MSRQSSSLYAPARYHQLMVTAALVAALLVGRAPPATSQMNYLSSARRFAVLGSSTVTNTGFSTIKGDIGVFPGLAITGYSLITHTGSVHAGDAVAQQGQVDANSAFVTLAALQATTDLSGQNLGGLTLTPGVYFFSSSALLAGNLVLDFLGNQNALFVFQIGTTLTTASASSVKVINGAPGGGVYWDVGSSATFGTGTSFLGNVIADASVTMTTGSSIICGRAIALNGAVTLDTNVISNDCSNGGDYSTGVDDNGSQGFSGAVPVTPAPEPASLALIATGFVAFTGALRRRRKIGE